VIAALIREARPKQWAKNVLVFAAPAAAGTLGHADTLWRSALLFLAFCAAASGTYFWNDVLDVEADRLHPTKRHRPVAAGVVPLGRARLAGSALLATGVALGVAARWPAGLVVAAYSAITLAYTFGLKHVVGLDLVAVAAGFVLRAVAGAVATRVPMSIWFVLCITFGSLFVVTGKRFAELHQHGDEAASMRPALAEYSPRLLRALLTTWFAATVVAYCLWAAARAGDGSNSAVDALSVLPVVGALARYRSVLAHSGGAPEEVFLHDRPLQVLLVCWAVLFGLGVQAR